MKIYLASSWRNTHYETVLQILQDAGYYVYDFRNPNNLTDGFKWKETGFEPPMAVADYLIALTHPRAVEALTLDRAALDECDVLVCLLPCGRSAHLELGYAIGRGKKTLIYTHDNEEPELMAAMADDIVGSPVDMVDVLSRWEPDFWPPYKRAEVQPLFR